jgi:hypothetical protein
MKLKLLLCSCCALLFCSLSSNAQSEREVRMWLTTPDRTALVAPQAAALHFSPEAGQLPVLAVDDAQHFQSIDGFGFALTGGSAQLLMRMGAAQRAALLKELFTTGDSGIGVSYLRVSIGSSDMNERVYSYDDLPPGETDVEMAKFNLGPDRTNVIPVLKEILAIRPLIKILGSPWSAPAWMKTNNDVKAGELRPEYYGAFARYFVNYIEAMHAEGIAIDAITVENEPLNPKNTPSMVVFAKEEDTFIANALGPALAKAGIRTKILLYDHNPDVLSYALSILAERNCTSDCSNNYILGHSDWVDMSAIISTTPDQIAIAPGSLVREWRQDGRRYFEYKLDHPSLNFYAFMSGRYEVAREEWNGIKLEVYYLKEQPWNVPRMMNSMKKSLAYYIKNFGPYEHKEARIIEFPRVAGFAQAFPGTMPYSESIGFIANLNHPDDIDSVFYVVAHEMAHQWWAHQVIGADMEGATLLSETLAQYSSFMVMEKEYGRDLMRKFLMLEMDNYLRSRGQERLKERPLLTVESEQGYIHYAKGGVVLYYMKEMIGEEAVNRALRKLIHQYAYAPPPYPTSYALVDALREETPPNLQYLIKDLFEDITLFSNRTLAATAVKRADGQYDVTINVEARKFKADAKGNETEVPVDDWIDIGAFAKPAIGRKYGDTFYRERMHIIQRNSTFTFTTAQLPEKAGIDPFALLIDRIPDDNVKNVTLESGPAQQTQIQ